MNREKFVRKIAEHGDSREQVIVCMEELGELSHALSKWLRGVSDMENLSEEIADVTLCLDELREIFGVGSLEIEERIQEKIDRFYGTGEKEE